MVKKSVTDLAFFGGSKIFSRPVSTSNLVKPDVESFLAKLKIAQTPQGEKYLINQLEKELAEFHGVSYCITVCSGFWALVLCIHELALLGKKEVIMPSLTYRRLADVVAWTGLVPRFCDVNPKKLSISAEAAKHHINSNTALIIGVHPIVNCCDIDSLKVLASENNLPLLFDSVESVYETYNSIRVGGFGAAECFSLHASKLINGFEGGYITTNNPELAAHLKLLRSPSKSQSSFGMQAHLPSAHAAMALQNLEGVKKQIIHNRDIYYTYYKLLSFVPGLTLILFDESEQSSFKNILVKLEDDWPLDRDTTVELMNHEGILSRAYYSPPLHMKPVKYPVVSSSLPVSEESSEHYLLMPCGYQVTSDTVNKVIEFMHFIREYSNDILKLKRRRI